MAAHTSKIKKSITRKVSTAPYESVDIFLEIEETIEWDTPAERMEKTENYTKLLIVDFMKTLDKVANTLGVNKKVATVNKTKDDKPQLQTNKKQNNSSFLEDDEI